ncbi:MAG: hypothetical protein K6T65_03935 [Peptococcaceae bacterium]|nr:hypothetical protein [Peptococcaceae bacterium]
MSGLNCQIQFAQNEKLKKISVLVSCTFFALSVLLFWLGMDFLKAEVFPHYYDAKRHTIVQQNPDTGEIYAWKDANGKVYTPDDSQIGNFTWGTTALLLLVMVLGSYGYRATMKYYSRMLLEGGAEPKKSYVPRLQ